MRCSVDEAWKEFWAQDTQLSIDSSQWFQKSVKVRALRPWTPDETSDPRRRFEKDSSQSARQLIGHPVLADPVVTPILRRNDDYVVPLQSSVPTWLCHLQLMLWLLNRCCSRPVRALGLARSLPKYRSRSGIHGQSLFHGHGRTIIRTPLNRRPSTFAGNIQTHTCCLSCVLIDRHPRPRFPVKPAHPHHRQAYPLGQ